MADEKVENRSSTVVLDLLRHNIYYYFIMLFCARGEAHFIPTLGDIPLSHAHAL